MGKDNNVFDDKYVLGNQGAATEQWGGGTVPLFVNSLGVLRERSTPYYALSSPPSPSNPLVFPDAPVVSNEPYCQDHQAAGVFFFNQSQENSGTGSFTPTISGSYEYVASGSGYYLAQGDNSYVDFGPNILLHDSGIELEMRFRIKDNTDYVALFEKRNASYTSGSAQFVLDTGTGDLWIMQNSGIAGNLGASGWQFIPGVDITNTDWHTIKYSRSNLNADFPSWQVMIDDTLVFYVNMNNPGDGRYTFPAETTNNFLLGYDVSARAFDIDYFIVRQN